MQDVISFSFSRTKIIRAFIVLTSLMLLWLSLFGYCLFWGILVGGIIFGCSFVLFFLFWLDVCKTLLKCLKGVPALQLTPQALIDNMNNVSFAWKDIQAFNEALFTMSKGSFKRSAPYIIICLYNEEYYLSRVHGWKRLIARLNSRSSGGAFTIGISGIKEDSSVVLESLNDFKYRYSD